MEKIGVNNQTTVGRLTYCWPSRTALLFVLFSVLTQAQIPDVPVRSVPDPGVITTGQTITPAGVPAIVKGKVYGVSFGKSSDELFVLSEGALYQLNWRQNQLSSLYKYKGRPGLQSLQYDADSGMALTAVAMPGARNQTPSVSLLVTDHGTLTPLLSGIGSYLGGALAIAPQPNQQGQRIAVLPLTYNDQLAVIDLNTRTLLAKIWAGTAPFGAAINRSGTTVYVSNWGGRVPKPGDRTATTGLVIIPENLSDRSRAMAGEPAKNVGLPVTPGPHDDVVIDRHGVAANGAITRIDLQNGRATAQIEVGLQPTAIVLDDAHQRLYVANSNDDSVSVIDTKRDRAIRKFRIQPFVQSISGVAPTALALSPDEKTLFVACGGINAVAVLQTATGQIDGLIPSAWYPASLALSPDGKYLAIGALLGIGPGARERISERSIFANRGSVHIVYVPDSAQLASYTTAVAENNHLAVGSHRSTISKPSTRALPIPTRAGDPSPTTHVVLIVKENRTYDQVLGDMEKGNGDPSLVMFGGDVTPNQHRLSSQFVLLDNFYATGGVSADGHQWLTQANETAYVMWPGYLGRSYPFDGTDPIAYSKSGFLWDLALARNKTVRVYGEFTPATRIPLYKRKQYLTRWEQGADFSSEFYNDSPIPALKRIMAHQYPGFTNSVPDVVRAQIFLKDLNTWQREGNMPDLILLQLNCDHTVGALPGLSTPKAMVADNDLALGNIVEALSNSRFWPKLAIFVVEDDAQDGLDHVDGHRTVALAISPYIRRGAIDSTFYSHQSILKSIELILGLPTMSLFDLIADDMRNAFQDSPDLRPYEAVTPKQSLDELNPPLTSLSGKERKGALASLHMNFADPDAALPATLNRIIWHSVRGWKTPYPDGKHRSLPRGGVDR